MEKGCIGILRNNWRGRMVYVYPTSDAQVVRTVGKPLDGKGKDIETTEPRRDWERVVSMFPKMATYD